MLDAIFSILYKNTFPVLCKVTNLIVIFFIVILNVKGSVATGTLYSPCPKPDYSFYIQQTPAGRKESEYICADF
jgi:hypothetical protein